MGSALRPVVVVGAAVVLSLIAGWAVDRSLRRIDARHPETPLWGLLRRCGVPLQV
ncbi:MAG TPA: mechanosensitive ion channel family protein, partial [Streptomyces sp.]